MDRADEAGDGRSPTPQDLEPGLFSKSLSDAILARVRQGESVAAICRDPEMPCAATVYGWVRGRPEFGAAFAETRRAARQDRADALVARRRARRFRKAYLRVSPRGGTGRPSSFSPAMAESICLGLARGRSLEAICREPGLPCVTTVYNWLDRHPEFAAAYAAARETQLWRLAEQAYAIVERVTPETVAEERLRFNTLKWRAAKLAPKGWGAGERPAVDAFIPPVPLAWREEDGGL